MSCIVVRWKPSRAKQRSAADRIWRRLAWTCSSVTLGMATILALTENDRLTITNEHSFCVLILIGGSMSTMATTTLLPTGAWSIDPGRSRIEFQIKQFGIATVRGAFTTFEGTLDVGDDARVRGSVTAASIDTGNDRRDAHLRSAEFLDAERFPTLSFESHAIEE